MISVDDHVLEPGHVWQERVPAKFKDAAPRLVQDAQGKAWILHEGLRSVTPGLGAVAGKRREKFSFEPITYEEMRPGCYDSVARLDDMNRAGVIASICFPSMPRFCGQVFLEAETKSSPCFGAGLQRLDDRRVVRRATSAAISPSPSFPCGTRDLGRGGGAPDGPERFTSAIAFSENPAMLGLPTIQDRGGYWDPLMAACEETETVVCMHIGSSSRRYTMSDESPMLVTMSWGVPVGIAGAMVEWIFSPVLRKFPGIKVALAEGGIG